jgi:TPR repeat protein
MGNRTFLYTTDKLPQAGTDEPILCDAVAEANNFLPPLWLALFSAAQPGPAQDCQQIFLPSVSGGIYAPRALAERRMFMLLECLAGHPGLDDRAMFERKTHALRAYCATLDGLAYSADLNEWFHLSHIPAGEDPVDQFIGECAYRWERAERAIAGRDYRALEELFEFDPDNAADTLGFRCWSHAYFDGYQRAHPEQTFEQFCLENDQADSDDWWVGHGMVGFEVDGKCGLRAQDGGAVILAPIYDSVGQFDEEIAVAALELDGLWGLYDVHGRVVLEPVLDELFEFEESVAVANQGGKFGYLDSRGRWLVQPRYDDGDAFSFGMALVKRDGLTGYINKLGAEVIAPQFLDGCDGFTEGGCAIVRTARGFGLIDRTGAIVVAPGYRAVEYLEHLQAWSAHSGGAHDVFYANGAPWFSSNFDGIDCLVAGGDALMKSGRAYGSVQRNGRPGIPFKYSNIALILASGPLLYEVTSGGKKELCGACLADGELVVPLQFASVDPMAFVPYEEHAPQPATHLLLQGAGRIGAWSLALQRQVLDCVYDDVWAFRVGDAVFLLAFKERRGWTVADDTGKVLNERPYCWLRDASITGSADYHAYWLGGDFVDIWSKGEAVRGACDGVAIRLHQDGREETELDYQLRRAYQATPIVTFDSLVQGLPLPAKARRFDSHVIAGAGNADACNALGDMYAAGWGVQVDRFKACRWYATAAAGGHREAQYWYGYHVMDGLGCEADPFAALAIFEALGAEHLQAQNCMGYLYETALGSKCDLKRARALYMAAAQGYSVAQFNAGNCWRHGLGGPVDLKVALRYYDMARDDPDAVRCAAEVRAELGN